jgi:hypothetical protein
MKIQAVMMLNQKIAKNKMKPLPNKFKEMLIIMYKLSQKL